MNISQYRIEPADFRTDYEDLRAVREAIGNAAQSLPADMEFDDLDPQCRHVLARDAEHRPIGCARLAPNFTISRLAVLPEWRGQGVGKGLLQNLIEIARHMGATQIAVNTPAELSEFYEKAGFSRSSATSEKAGITHQTLHLDVQPRRITARRCAKSRAASVKAADFDSLEQTATATVQLITPARRKLCIYSRDLEYNLYGRSEIVEALKRFAIQSRDGGIMIIVQDTAAVQSRPHPLLELGQRLPSLIQFRTPVEEDDLQYPSVYLFNDRDGYLFRLLGNRYEGDWSPALPARNRRLAEEFEQVWQRCRPCTEFRALGI